MYHGLARQQKSTAQDWLLNEKQPKFLRLPWCTYGCPVLSELPWSLVYLLHAACARASDSARKAEDTQVFPEVRHLP